MFTPSSMRGLWLCRPPQTSGFEQSDQGRGRRHIGRAGGAHVGAGELSGSSSSSSRFRPSRSSIQPSNARERRTRSAPRSSA